MERGGALVAGIVVPTLPSCPAQRRRRWRALAALLALAAILSASFAVPLPAHADSNTVPVTSISLDRLDNVVVKTTIVTAFATARDTVEVYNYAQVRPSADWRQATNMDNATWLFKPGGGTPKLAIFFTVEAGMHVARVYDDQFGEGAVPVTVRGNRVVLSHPVHWTLKAETAQPWIGADGQPADDLLVEGAFSLPNENDAHTLLAHRWRGQDAWSFRLADPKGTGVPAYSLMRLNAQAALSAAVPRAQLDVNVANYHLQPFRPAVFWPYLGNADVSVRSWFDLRPPLSMNWTTGQLQDFGSILPDLEPENGLQIFSVAPVVAHQVSDADFENPFAYYRFDPGHTGYPNLIIRHAYYPAGDPYLQADRSPAPVEFVRYSWGDGNGLVQYKLGLLGRHAATTTLQLGDIAVRTMDYQSLPAWVLDREWDFVTFVASETGGYRSSEGIYAWDYAPGDYSWLFGDSATLPLTSYQSIAAGFRGEYRVLPAGPTELYVSPVDGRLHLLGAQGGSWTIDDHQTITTASLDGQTVGQWVRSVDTVPKEAVYAVPGALLYSGADHVILQPATATAVVAYPPPKDEPSLATLRGLLPAQAPNVAKRGLQSLLEGNGRAGVTLVGAALTHVRLIQGGWRAELTLAPDAALRMDPGASPAFAQVLAAARRCGAAVGAQQAPLLTCPGSGGHALYVVEHTDNWHVTPATPADLRVRAVRATAAPSGPAEMPITIDLANRGQADTTGEHLRVWAQRSGEAPIDLATVAVDVPAGEDRGLGLSWLPPGPGRWTIGATLTPAGPAGAAGVLGNSLVTAVTVPAAPSAAWWLLGPTSSGPQTAAALAVLLAAGLLAAVAVRVILR